jgi:hypothetical protein
MSLSGIEQVEGKVAFQNVLKQLTIHSFSKRKVDTRALAKVHQHGSHPMGPHPPHTPWDPALWRRCTSTADTVPAFSAACVDPLLTVACALSLLLPHMAGARAAAANGADARYDQGTRLVLTYLLTYLLT